MGGGGGGGGDVMLHIPSIKAYMAYIPASFLVNNLGIAAALCGNAK